MKMNNVYEGIEEMFYEILLGEEKKKKERRIYHFYVYDYTTEESKEAPYPTSKEIAFLTPENVLLAQRKADISDTSFMEEISNTAYLLNAEVYSVKLDSENYLEYEDLLVIADPDDFLERKRFGYSLDRNKDNLVSLLNKLSVEDLEALISIKIKEELKKLRKSDDYWSYWR